MIVKKWFLETIWSLKTNNISSMWMILSRFKRWVGVKISIQPSSNLLNLWIVRVSMISRSFHQMEMVTKKKKNIKKWSAILEEVENLCMPLMWYCMPFSQTFALKNQYFTWYIISTYLSILNWNYLDKKPTIFYILSYLLF